jgi:beta-lactamase class A
MKNKGIFFLGFLLVFGGFCFWQYPFLKALFLALRNNREIISPLVSLPGEGPARPAGGQILGEITTLETDFDFGSIQPETTVLAQGAYVYDLSRGRVIFEKDAHRQLPASSTVKIVTAAVALDKGNLNEEMTVNWFPTVVGESSIEFGLWRKI